MKEIIYLVVMTWNMGMYPTFNYFEMESWGKCQQIVSISQLQVSTGDEAEGGAAIFCSRGMRRSWSATRRNRHATGSVTTRSTW